MTKTWRGIMPIVTTPFTDSYALDEAALRPLVAFSIEAGATGLVGPANAKRVFKPSLTTSAVAGSRSSLPRPAAKCRS